MSAARLAMACAAAAVVVLLATPAAAHVSVTPREAGRGTVATLTFRVPNERDDATTTKVEIEVPADPPITDATVAPLDGWTSEVRRDGDRVARIAWTAASPDAAIAGEARRDFTVALGPLPSAGDTVVFKALQTYSDGEVVRWIEEPVAGGAEPGHPAPTLRLTGVAPATTTTSTATPSTTTSTTSTTTAEPVAEDDDDADGVPIAALVVGAVVLSLLTLAAVRARRYRAP